MKKILVIGLVGESVFLTCDHFHKPGETIICDKKHVEFGGKGFNQAFTIKTLGGNIKYLGCVGSDNVGKTIIENTKILGVDAKYVVHDKETTYGVILTDKEGNNEVSVYQGAELTCEDILENELMIKEADIILLQLEIPLEVINTIIELAEKHHKTIILNPAPAISYQEVFNNCSYFTPNECEAETLFGKDYLTYMCNNNINGVITLGDKGCIIVEKGNVTRISGKKVKAVDTTGAGDVFSGALTYMLANGSDLTTAAIYANNMAAKSVQYHYVLEGIKKLV